MAMRTKLEAALECLANDEERRARKAERLGRRATRRQERDEDVARAAMIYAAMRRDREEFEDGSAAIYMRGV